MIDENIAFFCEKVYNSTNIFFFFYRMNFNQKGSAIEYCVEEI